MEDKYLTITQINRYLKYKFDRDENLNTVYLKGEISNYKNHSSGHLYFTLKDENSRILAIMFKSYASKIDFKPEDGSKVLVIGKISIYEATGAYQIYVEQMIQDGVGNLYLEFEKLKKKLQSEGLFDPVNKKPIPKFPKKIGIITATTGAAIRDIITTINRRYRLTEIFIFPCLVQGEGAKEDIVKCLKQADSLNLDVILLGRGGGSIEDLWAFNEEIVAKEIFNAKTPIISGVGHEVDFTISDFVADLRAPTPTAAAELAVPSTIDLINTIKQLELRSNKSIKNTLANYIQRLASIKESYILKNPERIYEIKMQKVDSLTEKLIYLLRENLNTKNNKYNNLYKDLNISINNLIDNKNNKYSNLIEKLKVLNPLNTIKRGYSITLKNDKSITDIKSLKIKDMITTKLKNGTIKSEITEIKES